MLTTQSAIVAGYLLFTLHSRARVHDSSRIVNEPAMDLAADLKSGFADSDSVGQATKSGQTQKRATLAIPFVGHS